MRKKRIKIQLDPQVESRLEELGLWYGYTTTALIRACIDRALPDLERFLDEENTRRLAKQPEPGQS